MLFSRLTAGIYSPPSRWQMKIKSGVSKGARKQIVTLQTHPYQSGIFLIPSTVIGEHLLSPNLQIFMTRRCSISPSCPESGSSSSHSNRGCARKLSLSWAFKQIIRHGASEFPLKSEPGTQLSPLRKGGQH